MEWDMFNVQFIKNIHIIFFAFIFLQIASNQQKENQRKKKEQTKIEELKCRMKWNWLPVGFGSIWLSFTNPILFFRSKLRLLLYVLKIHRMAYIDCCWLYSILNDSWCFDEFASRNYKSQTTRCYIKEYSRLNHNRYCEKMENETRREYDLIAFSQPISQPASQPWYHGKWT